MYVCTVCVGVRVFPPTTPVEDVDCMSMRARVGIPMAGGVVVVEDVVHRSSRKGSRREEEGGGKDVKLYIIRG